jgi:5-methylcytosine-specific restriction endonuclease McrA
MCKNHIPKSPLKKFTVSGPKRDMVVYTGADGIKMIEDVVNHSLKLEMRNQLFLSVWETRNHRCEICGKHLGNEPRSYMFDHLLEKSKYEFLEYEPDNIALVCLECHDNKTRGNINAKYQEKINFVITKFNVS